jgi:hypothetical protein
MPTNSYLLLWPDIQCHTAESYGHTAKDAAHTACLGSKRRRSMFHPQIPYGLRRPTSHVCVQGILQEFEAKFCMKFVGMRKWAPAQQQKLSPCAAHETQCQRQE